jgi:hypothetical protein
VRDYQALLGGAVALTGRNHEREDNHMEYVQPQIVNVYDAVDAIQSIHASKPGDFSDSNMATSTAYEADE